MLFDLVYNIPAKDRMSEQVGFQILDCYQELIRKRQRVTVEAGHVTGILIV